MSRRVVVTGASSEIGAAICRKILKSSDFAVLHYSGRGANLDELASSLPCESMPLRADFSSAAELTALCGEVENADILVNCAALVPTGLMLESSDEAVESAILVNVTALTKLCRAAVRGMAMRRRGVIVNISSVVARKANRGQAVYAGTKGYMEAFSRALAAEYGSRSVRVNCVAPGPVRAGNLKALLSDAEAEIKGSIALRRLGTPDDVACAVAYLCSDEAAYVTGTVLSIDGGFSMGVG